MIKCLAKDRNCEPCRHHGLTNSRFCVFHQYMNEYTDEMLSKIQPCSGCKMAYYITDGGKTCESCRDRGKKNRASKEKPVLCSKKDCPSKRSQENIYCGRHQLCQFEDETVAMNKKVCKNCIRGCRSQLNMDYQHSNCEECLEKDREKDRNRRGFVKEQNRALENIPDATPVLTKLCTTCCKELPMEQFLGIKETVVKTCLSCRNDNKLQDSRRDKEHRNETCRNNMRPQYTSYKKGARERELQFELSFEDYEKIVVNPCHYCGILEERGFNGIDRKNSGIGYIIENCVSCCQMCNYMKGSLSESVFIKRACHILTHQNIVSRNLYPECFAHHKKCSYNQYRNKAVNMGIEFSITIDDYTAITSTNCYICGKENGENNENGMDRLDNKHGYTIQNIKACCAECNCMKIDYDFQDILLKFASIYQHYKDFDKMCDDSTADARCVRFVASRYKK